MNDEFMNMAAASLQGLLASGNSVSYETAHQAYKMAQMMVEVKSQYVVSPYTVSTVNFTGDTMISTGAVGVP